MTEKLKLNELVEKMDATKKANPLDLSSDQDLTIALMNLISLEEHFKFSGAKTGKTSFYDMIQEVRDMRGKLMQKIVQRNNGGAEVWCISKHLLAASMRLFEVGDKQFSLGNKQEAYDMYDRAYELYSLFWGVNMNLIDCAEVVAAAPEIEEGKGQKAKVIEQTAQSVQDKPRENSVAKRLGAWVKNAVNCCIE
ncbi:MAG: hypothetical protein LBJ18_04535 [Rickettsiales bacterium]|jgi:hypothetical protein|nr:hypothetical protein [Rickettsiales bacterium]